MRSINPFLKVCWVLGSSALLSCAGGTGIPTPEAVQGRVALLAFTGTNACSDLEKYLEDSAVLEMRADLEAQRDQVPGWGWWGGGFRGGVDVAFAPNAAGSAETKSAPPPKDFTTTNTQVKGVDEADFVKNDGTRIFVLSGGSLYSTLSWPATSLSRKGKLNIEGWPREMYLDEKNRVVVFSQVWQPRPLDPNKVGAGGLACSPLSCGFYYGNMTKVTVVDVSQLDNMKVTSEYYLPGNYDNSRRIGSAIRLVQSDTFQFPSKVSFYPEPPLNPTGLYDQNWYTRLYNDKAFRADVYNKLIASNEMAIRSMSLTDWLDTGHIKVNGVEAKLALDCTSFSKVNAPTRLGRLSVVTINLDTPSSVISSSILGESGEVYASSSSLYVATRHWWWWPAPGQTDTTYFHKFDIRDPLAAKYVASGSVEGHIVDQFSMDEDAKGYFRMATNISRRVVDPANPQNWWGRVENSNRVSVFGELNNQLVIVGQTPELAKGESIQSSRFVEGKGFVVTFRQVDPLFTIDLNDPKNPRVLGELTIPGFSSYMQPIDDTHLLTIGEYLPAPVNGVTNWQARSIQLSIFDVTDMKAPRQSFTQKVGDASSYSEAQYEHKAFNYFAAKKLLAIPFADWNSGGTSGNYWSTFISDLRVFGVDTTTGFTVKGALSMSDLFSQVYSGWGWSYYWMPNVRRSVMADDFVYAISDAGLRVANIADLSKALAEVKFDHYDESSTTSTK